MSVQTKKRFKSLVKIIAATLFALIMFTNIKVALMDEGEIASGDISVLGLKMKLFEPTYAEIGFDDCIAICYTGYICRCTYLIGYGWCPGKPRY